MKRPKTASEWIGVAVALAHQAADEIESLRSRLAELQDWAHTESLNTVRLNARLNEAERDMDQLIGERDHAQDMADKLADAIATLLGVEIGEHSNMNCPWTQALEAFEARPTVSADAAPVGRCPECGFGESFDGTWHKPDCQAVNHPVQKAFGPMAGNGDGGDNEQ